jgi:hypothetical protein
VAQVHREKDSGMNPDAIRNQRIVKGSHALLIGDTRAVEETLEGNGYWDLPLRFDAADKLAKRYGGNKTMAGVIRAALMCRNG